MKPLGLYPRHNKEDHRIHRNHRKVPNWWEVEQEPNKTKAKCDADKEIQTVLEE